MRYLALFLSLLALGSAKPVTLLVSIDGCRWDYPELHRATFLQELAAAGTRVERLIPAYPTKTFPNHYTLVTGLRPAEHGIIQNKFYDPSFETWFGIGSHPAAREGRWWGGEPIWNTLARQGKSAACMFWPGAEADINGRHPDEWMPYQHELPTADRIEQVVTWITAPQPPDFVTLYFSLVDSAGHDFGPTAAETGAALREIDTALRSLRDRLVAAHRWDELTLIVTADHGMTKVDTRRVLLLDDLVESGTVLPHFTGACTGLQVLPPHRVEDVVATINASHRPVRAYARADVPARLHFSASPRIPDVVLIPDLGWRVWTSAEAQRRVDDPPGGDHGYDNTEPEMAAIFLAVGPRIAAGAVLPPTDSIHVYNLLCALSGVTPAPNSGDERLVSALLKPR